MSAGNNVVNFLGYPKRDFYAVVEENIRLAEENQKLKELVKRFKDLNSKQLEEAKPKRRRKKVE